MKPQQLNLLHPSPPLGQPLATPDGEARKRDGQDRAWQHANADWKSAALQIVRELATTTASFTTDQVWEQLDGTDLSTPEPRAMGAVMRKAALLGWVRRTSYTTPTRRPCANKRPVAVWQSLLKRR